MTLSLRGLFSRLNLTTLFNECYHSVWSIIFIVFDECRYAECHGTIVPIVYFEKTLKWGGGKTLDISGEATTFRTENHTHLLTNIKNQ